MTVHVDAEPYEGSDEEDAVALGQPLNPPIACGQSRLADMATYNSMTLRAQAAAMTAKTT